MNKISQSKTRRSVAALAMMTLCFTVPATAAPTDPTLPLDPVDPSLPYEPPIDLNPLQSFDYVEVQGATDLSGSHFIDANGALWLDSSFGEINAFIETGSLAANHTYSLWWLISHAPEYCAVPDVCTSADLADNGGDPRAEVFAMWATEIRADDEGFATVSIKMQTNAIDHGLATFKNQAIHLLLSDHSH